MSSPWSPNERLLTSDESASTARLSAVLAATSSSKVLRPETGCKAAHIEQDLMQNLFEGLPSLQGFTH